MLTLMSKAGSMPTTRCPDVMSSDGPRWRGDLAERGGADAAVAVLEPACGSSLPLSPQLFPRISRGGVGTGEGAGDSAGEAPGDAPAEAAGEAAGDALGAGSGLGSHARHDPSPAAGAWPSPQMVWTPCRSTSSPRSRSHCAPGDSGWDGCRVLPEAWWSWPA